MKQRCENCSRPLLESDDECYHCGAPVSGRQPKETPAEETVDLRAAARYAVVVLGLLVLGSLLMSWMGAGISAETDLSPTPAAPDGWREYIPAGDDYAIHLPESWELYTGGSAASRQLSADRAGAGCRSGEPPGHEPRPP